MSTIKTKMGESGLSRKISLLTAVLSIAILVIYCIYGTVYNYFDTVVCGFIAGAILLAGLHFLLSGAAVCNLPAVMCTAGAIALFFLNSYPVWADELNGITMYNSRGGLAPVITILVLLLVSAIAETVSCFIPEKEV